MTQVTRNVRLDGLRGLATAMVVFSHYLGEVPSRIPGFAIGYIAVQIFFVLSGFLIGGLVLDRRESGNFFKVFYARRLLRTIPSYAVVVATIFGIAAFGSANWIPKMDPIPTWSYMTFTQNLAIANTLQIGNEWLGPTWTLAVEEQFYLIAPFAIIFLTARWLMPAVLAIITASIVYRLLGTSTGAHPLTYLLHLLGHADALAAGLGAALIQRRYRAWPKYDRALESVPLICLLGTFASLHFSPIPIDLAVAVIVCPLLALGAAAFILRLGVSTSASMWLSSPLLRDLGHNSYSIYLVHMPIAGIVHGLITSSRPDISNSTQIAATGLSFAATLVVAVLLTKLVEDPATRLGRTFRWSNGNSIVSSPS